MKVYKINWRNQLLSIKYWFGLLILFLLFVGIAYSNPDNGFGFVLVPVVLIWGLPPLILHVIYWVRNKNTVFAIDKQTISISDDIGISQYQLSDVIVAEKHVGVYYRHHGKITSWTNYGYIKFETKDGKMLFITSLILNPRTFDDIPCKTVFDFFPLFNKSTYDEKQRIENHINNVEKTESDELIQKYIEEFQSRSNEELLAKVNDNRYKPEAVAAAKQILEERRNFEEKSDKKV